MFHLNSVLGVPELPRIPNWVQLAEKWGWGGESAMGWISEWEEKAGLCTGHWRGNSEVAGEDPLGVIRRLFNWRGRAGGERAFSLDVPLQDHQVPFDTTRTLSP